MGFWIFSYFVDPALSLVKLFLQSSIVQLVMRNITYSAANQRQVRRLLNGPLRRCHTISTNFPYIFHMTKNASVDQFIIPNLVDTGSFVRIRWKVIDIWDSEQGASDCPPGIHFFVQPGKFGVLYFDEFATNSYETSHIY